MRVLFITVTNLVYNCNQCSYEGKSNGHVKQHIATQHDGVPYNCNQCSYKFKWKSDLKDHVEMQHEDVVYNCNQCNNKGKKSTS